MSIYSIGVLSVNTTIDEPALEIIAGASDRSRLLELQFNLCATSAAASNWGLGRPASVGTASTSYTVLAEDYNAPAGRTVVVTEWSSKSTSPTSWIRRTHFPTLNTAACAWLFPNGLVIPASESLVLWNITTTYVVSCNTTVEE
jgi:hypothetical protein